MEATRNLFNPSFKTPRKYQIQDYDKWILILLIPLYMSFYGFTYVGYIKSVITFK